MSSIKALLKESVLDLKKILTNVDKFAKYPKLFQSLLKKLCVVWSQDDDARRVLALIIIVKALKNHPHFFDQFSKGMFLVYVKNSKFIFGLNIGTNNFMRNGLLEVYSLQPDEAYKHAFIFIRQLAITLRKAFLRANKDDMRAVYNWQFICSLRFWSEFVARHANSHELIRTLIHPLVQVILGTVRLSPGSRWIALRFHCIEFLHIIAGIDHLRSRVANSVEDKSFSSPPVSTLVPSLPLLLDVFRIFDFNRRSSTASNVPMDLRLMLHFSPSQRRETACVDAVCTWLHDLLTESLALYSSSLAFPEYSSPAVTEIRAFLKTCRIANFTRDFRALVNKVREHDEFIQKKRSAIKSLNDINAITAAETSLAQTDSPFMAYYAIHRGLRVSELTRLAERFKNMGTLTAISRNHTGPILDVMVFPSGTVCACLFKGKMEENADPFARQPEVKPKPGRKRKPDDKGEDEESEESDAESDASYDIDDGENVTHVSGSKKKTPDGEDSGAGDEGSGDSDFDLDYALNEEEKDNEEEDTDAGDQLTDFKLDDSDDEDPETRNKLRLEDPDLAMDSMSEGEDDVEGSAMLRNAGVDIDSLSEDDEEDEVDEQSAKRTSIGKGKKAIPKQQITKRGSKTNNKCEKQKKRKILKKK